MWLEVSTVGYQLLHVTQRQANLLRILTLPLVKSRNDLVSLQNAVRRLLKGTKSTARWWKCFDIVCTRDKGSDAMTGVHLLCKLLILRCQQVMRAGQLTLI